MWISVAVSFIIAALRDKHGLYNDPKKEPGTVQTLEQTLLDATKGFKKGVEHASIKRFFDKKRDRV